MSRGYSQEQIQNIRKKIIDGQSKHAVAKELGLSPDTVYKYTSDLPNKFQRDPYISGKPLDLLKELLEKGFVYTQNNRNNLRSLQKYFPSIKRSQYKNKSIYYLEDKNKLALQEMMKKNESRIINYQELKSMSKLFHTDISSCEKKRFFGRFGPVSRKRRQRSKKRKVVVSQEKQSRIDDFLGRFLHSEVLVRLCVI